MMDGRWRTAYASVVGTSHIKTGSPCQDTGGCAVVAAPDDSEILVAAVSDGAGTACRSEAGSALAVGRFLTEFAEAAGADPQLSSIDRGFVDKWLVSFRDQIAEMAETEGQHIRDYACTLLGAVIGPHRSAYLQIGDGAIVVAGEEAGEYNWIFWPQHGEYANSTYFLTQDDAAEALLFETGPPVHEIALFSDGIERLVLDLSTKIVHSPAFSPIFQWLASTNPDESASPSPALATYLASDHVNSRTDDDKTLVMATRAKPATSAS
jgi:hypothetical protein